LGEGLIFGFADVPKATYDKFEELGISLDDYHSSQKLVIEKLIELGEALVSHCERISLHTPPNCENC